MPLSVGRPGWGWGRALQVRCCKTVSGLALPRLIRYGGREDICLFLNFFFFNWKRRRLPNVADFLEDDMGALWVGGTWRRRVGQCPVSWVCWQGTALLV